MNMVWKDVSFRKNLNLCRFIDQNVRILIKNGHPRRTPPRESPLTAARGASHRGNDLSPF